MRTAIACVLSVGCFLPLPASEPGQPLDCSDWVFLEPGFSCADKVPYPCLLADGSPNYFCYPGWPGTVVDHSGNLLQLQETDLADGGGLPILCDGFPLKQIELVRWNGSRAHLLGFIQERCVNDVTEQLVQTGDIFFDPYDGALLLRLRVNCQETAQNPSCHGFNWWIAEIRGFETTFEILQTYDPTADQIGFRVPYMPEGFPAADYFDTYHGDLASVGDFSQAQSLQCSYPAAAPSIGDYLTVSDPLPDPQPGQGRYYVTAVTFQGDRRLGRRSIDAQLVARNPSQLPNCGSSATHNAQRRSP